MDEIDQKVLNGAYGMIKHSPIKSIRNLLLHGDFGVTEKTVQQVVSNIKPGSYKAYVAAASYWGRLHNEARMRVRSSWGEIASNLTARLKQEDDDLEQTKLAIKSNLYRALQTFFYQGIVEACKSYDNINWNQDCFSLSVTQPHIDRMIEIIMSKITRKTSTQILIECVMAAYSMGLNYVWENHVANKPGSMPGPYEGMSELERLLAENLKIG